MSNATPGMKSAEEWHHSEKYVADQRSRNPNWRCECISCCNVRSVQRDAYRAGMTKAAEIATQCGQATAHLDYIKRCCDELATAIITERDAATSEGL